MTWVKSVFCKGLEEEGVLSRWRKWGRLVLEVTSELVLGERTLPVRTPIKHYPPPLKNADQALASRIKESQV